MIDDAAIAAILRETEDPRDAADQLVGGRGGRRGPRTTRPRWWSMWWDWSQTTRLRLRAPAGESRREAGGPAVTRLDRRAHATVPVSWFGIFGEHAPCCCRPPRRAACRPAVGAGRRRRRLRRGPRRADLRRACASCPASCWSASREPTPRSSIRGAGHAPASPPHDGDRRAGRLGRPPPGSSESLTGVTATGHRAGRGGRPRRPDRRPVRKRCWCGSSRVRGAVPFTEPRSSAGTAPTPPGPTCRAVADVTDRPTARPGPRPPRRLPPVERPVRTPPADRPRRRHAGRPARRRASPAAPRPRPARGPLVFSSGETVEVDRPVLVGRAPEARRFPSTDQPRLVTVPSPHQEISSTHLEVRPGLGRRPRQRRRHRPGLDQRHRAGPARPAARGPPARHRRPADPGGDHRPRRRGDHPGHQSLTVGPP